MTTDPAEPLSDAEWRRRAVASQVRSDRRRLSEQDRIARRLIPVTGRDWLRFAAEALLIIAAFYALVLAAAVAASH